MWICLRCGSAVSINSINKLSTFLVHFSLAIEGLQTIEGNQSKTPEGNTGSLGGNNELVNMEKPRWKKKEQTDIKHFHTAK